ncbi:hypothetical protein [Cerasicoccus arenae]|uniref:hypothetical protein n=1 Tax=Cerasicoccus arenae TaxID=424488 RepID=UPI0016758284|nr:hypothetical protein [Cerasicoccus arenae]MBK1857104.1 hypothetical protein [Cerasicoccus arenae]
MSFRSSNHGYLIANFSAVVRASFAKILMTFWTVLFHYLIARFEGVIKPADVRLALSYSAF